MYHVPQVLAQSSLCLPEDVCTVVSPWVSSMVACLATACLAGLGKGAELGISEEELEVVEAAVDSSDR